MPNNVPSHFSDSRADCGAVHAGRSAGWRKVCTAGIIVCVLAVMGGLWFGKGRGLIAAPSVPLRIAISPWPGYEFATLAREKGFFAEEGVDVRLLELSSLGDCRRAFERGQADGFFGTVIEVLLSHEQSVRRAQISLVTDYSDGADVVLAVPSIRSVRNLAGKRVGIENGSINAMILARALEQAGLKWEDVTTVHLAAIDMPSAIAAGEVDAVVTYPPMSIDVQKAATAREIFSSKMISGEIIDVLAFDEGTVRERAKDVAAFTRAFCRAQEYAKEHPAESYRIMAARERISPEEFQAAITDGIVVVDRAGQRAFFGPEGKLKAVVSTTDRVLRSIGQLNGPASSDRAIATVGVD